MAKRETKGVLVTMNYCTDPSKEAEFNKWYTQVHLPGIMSTGQFHTATRYVNVGGRSGEFHEPPKPGEPKYLIILETDWEDPAAAYEDRSKTGSPWAKNDHWKNTYAGTYKISESITGR